jgi:molecular chaperone HtpG
MAIPYDQTALIQFLKAKQPELYGKVVELRTAVEGWLAYIPQSFSHYTRHTVLHSDAIVLQMSKLLFANNDPAAPVLMLSPMEAYIAVASAYLHDSGMVISDDGKAKIIQSDEWKAWTSGHGNGAQRWEEIGRLRSGHSPADANLRHFLADVQTRFLIAEFVRRVHHLRAKDILTKNEDQLGRFAFNNPALLRVIGDVCVAHGLSQRDLEDRERYPDRRDIDGQEVNVQFLAILLRLGDLLDMDYDRACPLLLSVACPLPAESLAHWTQYRCITHRLTAPDRIEITAECQNQEEHRFLSDWCQWLVEETRNASILVARSHRHQSWPLPIASMDGADSTIHIRPAQDAKYIPSRWKFELDTEAVFDRLIGDIYENPIVFVRELIQNALDATRCQLYLDLKNSGEAIPEFPTQAPEERRKQYPISIRLEERQVKNDLSGSDELRQAIVIEDRGLGMDKDVVHRYLLQVGRSFYTTQEFQRKFGFVPTSRFGLGFLSVFGVSDRVTIDTFKPTSGSNDGPLHIVLTGPRNYLLIEKGSPRSSGTRIEVLLREPIERGVLTKAIRSWCRKVEFPLLVNDLGPKTEISSERPNDFIYDVPVVTQPDARFVLRFFDMERYGIEGGLYILAYVGTEGERWDLRSWSQHTYPKLNPQASPPVIPDIVYCVHGIVVRRPYQSSAARYRVDFRDGSLAPTLSRGGQRHGWMKTWDELDERIISRWEEVLEQHLQTAPYAMKAGWKYKQALVDEFSFESFWEQIPGGVAFRTVSGLQEFSLREVLGWKQFDTLISSQVMSHDRDSVTHEIALVSEDSPPLLTRDEREHLSASHRIKLYKGRSVQSLRWLPDGRAIVTWTTSPPSGIVLALNSKTAYLTSFGVSRIIGFVIHKTIDDTYSSVLLNVENGLVAWMLRVIACTDKNEYGITREQFSQLFVLLYDAAAYNSYSELNQYLSAWARISTLPSELRPPYEEVDGKMFYMTRQEINELSRR